MGGRGSEDSLRDKDRLDDLTGWNTKSDRIEDNEDLMRFLNGLQIIGPIGYKGDKIPRAYRFGTREFFWREAAEEARYQRMLAAERLALQTKMAIIIGSVTLLTTLTIIADKIWANRLEREAEITLAKIQMRDWLISEGVNVDANTRDLYARFVGVHENDFEDLIEWMKANGFDDFLPK